MIDVVAHCRDNQWKQDDRNIDRVAHHLTVYWFLSKRKMPDIARDPAFLKRRRLRRIGYGVATTMVLIAVSIVVARMEPAPRPGLCGTGGCPMEIFDGRT
jgi:hypothetical protein